jgi:DNA-binding beta-propeller fold protein YncE
MSTSRVTLSAALVAFSLSASPAFALSVEVTHAGPSLVGEAHVFTATVTEAVGEVTFQWQFGEGAPEPGGAEMSRTFTAPGHYFVAVEAIDAEGNGAQSLPFQHLVHYPLTEARPASSSSIIYDAARNRVYSLNQDNDTVTSIDPDQLTKLAELEVYRKPESLALSPEGMLWIVHQDDYAVAVVDPETFVIERGFRLPYASQPVAIAMSPAGDAAYISLMALGKLIKLEPRTGDVLGECEVGARPRGLSVSHDGKDVYVSRFISSDTEGEVVKVDGTAMTVSARIPLAIDSDADIVDSDLQARGVPNYLFTVALTPDGRQAWVPGKKDNVLRGLLRDGQDLTHDTTVRPITAVIDTLTAREIRENRVDLDNRSMPVHVEFTPYGDFAILALAGSNRIEIREVTNPTVVWSAIPDVGRFPRASVLAPNRRLFVQGALSRDILAYDLTQLVDYYDKATPLALAPIPAVAAEKLSEQVLEGKKIFHNAEDTRMAFEGYMSCGACHFEGIDDGRVFDFSTRGEGLRNTVSLLGRKGMKQGPLNWTGNLDEIQDFEHQIREFFDGTGFLPTETLNSGTRNQPLGDPKAGLSPELDALAAYVDSLDHVNPSPYRNDDCTLTSQALAGKAHFEKLGCDFCHGGSEFTDSMRGTLHDVGTITEASGTRAGEPLFGFDSPTLLGVWETPPYLHDGSAPTVRDVLTTKNPDGLHGYVSSLSAEQIDELVAYVMQIDNELPARRLPFEPAAPNGASCASDAGAGAGGMGATGASGGIGGAGGSPGGAGGAGARPMPAETDTGGTPEGCACELALGASRDRRHAYGALISSLSVWGLLFAVAYRRRRRDRGAPASQPGSRTSRGRRGGFS